MIADNIRVKIQHANDIGLQLKSKIQDGKLIVKALSLDDKIEYQGELQPHPYIDFQDIQELIDQNKKIKIVTKTPTLLKIKVGATPIQLIGKEKIDLENLSEIFEKFMKSQLLMEKQMKEQKDELYEHKNFIAGLRRQIDELKLGQSEKNSKFQKFEQNFTLEKSDLENKIQQNMNEINKIKQEMKNEIELMKLQPESYKNQIDALKDEINTIKLENQKTSIDVSEHDRRLKQIKDEIKRISSTMSELEQHNNNFIQTSETVVQLSEKLKNYENKITQIESYLLNQIKFPFQQLAKFLSSLQMSRLNEPIRSSKWSEQLKSKSITINNKIVTKTKQTDYFEFCLLNASFSNTIKSKQSWAIKINKMTKWIRLGVCLKSKMLNYNFNNKNIHWNQTGHGLYRIDSDGDCYSHSQKEFNRVNKSFEFGENDVIYVEYDPIDLKLRFSKNKVEYFEMPIIAPLQNDAYHPFVGLLEQNDSAELIQPQQHNK